MLLAQVARQLEDVVAVGHHAVGQAQQGADPQRAERCARREVRVQVIGPEGGDPAGLRGELAQGRDALLAPPAPPPPEVAQAAQRVANRQPGHVPQPAPPESSER